MPTPRNQELYEKAKDLADKIYKKPSAFRSGFIVKKYKELGGSYANDGKLKNLKRWFQEGWVSVGGKYPTYRPTKRISDLTPLTINEISKTNLKKTNRIEAEDKR